MDDTVRHVGVISDTHGLLRPEAVSALRGVDLLVHAGDVGDRDILDRLSEVAPITTVRGNVDTEPWARSLPVTALVEAGAHSLYLIHDLGQLDVDPIAAGIRCVVSGHSHRAQINDKGGTIYLNPGSAGPRRFDIRPTVARIDIDGTQFECRLIELDV